jgi:membrane protein YqaA with SNARE-associated domain
MLTELFTLLESYGYVGAFLISLISSLTIILPLPSAAFVFGLGSVLNPMVLGIVARVGAAIGETLGYIIGLGSRKVLKKNWKKQMVSVEKLFAKYGGFFVLFVFAATPLPDDIAGIVGGVLKYPFKKYFLAILLGKIVLNVVVAYAGFYGTAWVLNYFS